MCLQAGQDLLRCQVRKISLCPSASIRAPRQSSKRIWAETGHAGDATGNRSPRSQVYVHGRLTHNTHGGWVFDIFPWWQLSQQGSMWGRCPITAEHLSCQLHLGNYSNNLSLRTPAEVFLVCCTVRGSYETCKWRLHSCGVVGIKVSEGCR